ncbi:MAG: hypothetical protein ETSY1_41605 [Candidatus Entotheonella factor]|uniref:Uncharacterized protein n=1 Tax=Entotheonella factor TaxID=1429438 RepID=W4L486_ENTF1|nr:MAG: hypothetical protein ETSY1_41605 [Candidatus Entotheonella factor]
MHRQLPGKLQAILEHEFAEALPIIDLFVDMLHTVVGSRPLMARLLEVASGRTGEPWDVRQIATLMLEHQVLKLPARYDDDHHFLLSRLGLSSPHGDGDRVLDMVLKEGYTTTQAHAFVRELHRKLEKLNRVHHQIKGDDTTEEGLRDFLFLARQPCKLALARYLFTPQEVVQQIQQHVKHSKALHDLLEPQHPYMTEEAEYLLSTLPDYEANILRMLSESSRIYWVSDQTSSATNAFVQYPVGTVVLVLKPPGSDFEIELKRAGLRGEQVLGIVYERQGWPVPTSHRLQGGSSKWALYWEAGAAALFSRIYRLVHGSQAPISRTTSRATIKTIPVGDHEVQTLDYFTASDRFGAGFHDMRHAMKQSIEAFKQERSWSLPELPGDLGLTVQFINHAAPAQAILAGTSAFRLDWLAGCFGEGVPVETSGQDPKRFIDCLLEEVLGVYTPPEVRYRDSQSYVDDALAKPENRSRANRVYLSVMGQMGRFWGTLLAVGGYSNGESVIGRNVGLKSVWDQGQWHVRIVFMDHDGLCIIGKTGNEFRPYPAVIGMVSDEAHLLGSRSSLPLSRGAYDYLADIYRIEPETGNEGERQFHQELEYAYDRTKHQLAENAALKGLFHPSVIEELEDWGRWVVRFLDARERGTTVECWNQETRQRLEGEGYETGVINEYVSAMSGNEFFLKRQRYFDRYRVADLGS